MFNFKAPKSAGYQEAVERARLINGIRKDLNALRGGPMLEFVDAAALEVAIDQEITRQRT